MSQMKSRSSCSSEQSRTPMSPHSPCGGLFNQESSTPWLVDRSRLPRWSRTSWIIYGYRPLRPSVPYCLGTIFKIHNESANIWTHLFGVLLFLAIALGVFSGQHKALAELPMSTVDYLLLGMFFVGATTCMTLSACVHTFGCHSQEAVRLFSKLDYVGITLLIGCSFVPWLYYGWFNSPWWAVFYIALSCSFALGCIIVSLMDRFGERQYLQYRAALFLGDGLSALLPAVHWLTREAYHQGKEDFLRKNHWPGILLAIMGGSYTFGGLLYMFRVPERFAPGRFDLWFNSHQLFHLMVVAGALFYYHSLTQIMHLRLTEPGHFYN